MYVSVVGLLDSFVINNPTLFKREMSRVVERSEVGYILQVPRTCYSEMVNIEACTPPSSLKLECLGIVSILSC